MFEKYTEKARRVIFFARSEVSEHGAASIGTEHLLLGLLREDKALLSHFLPADVSIEVLREQVKAGINQGEKISTSVEVPLSEESKNVLQSAAEQSKGLSHRHIGTEHLLLGLLGVQESLAARVLRENGLSYSDVRKIMEDESWRLS